MKEFNYNTLKKLTDKAIEPYLVSIEEALNNPSNQHLNRYQQVSLVKQMFHRSLRLMSFNFLQTVDEYVNQLMVEEIEKEKKVQAKKEKTTSSIVPKTNQKKTLKELREERAKRNKE